MVNHNALARQFTVSDNFYMEPEASGVGHSLARGGPARTTSCR